MTRIGGVDGCRAGWLLLTFDGRTAEVQAAIILSASELVARAQDLDVLTIDIPIGLSDDGPRTCDMEARRLLGPGRASSVFPAPVRAAIAAATYAEACELSRRACGRGLSRQGFAILSRIREIDDQLRRLPHPQRGIREVHPEVCFYFINGLRPMLFRKKVPQGREERRVLTEPFFPSAFASVRERFPRKAVASDDILDALVALWTAQRIVGGTAVTVPEKPPLDRYGLRMEMVA